MSSSSPDIVARHSSICCRIRATASSLSATRRRVRMTCSSCSRNTTATNTMTIMTDVSHYTGPVLPYGEELMRVQRCRFRSLMTSYTVVDERLGVYPTVEGRGPTEPFNKSLPSLVTPTKYLLYPVRLIFLTQQPSSGS